MSRLEQDWLEFIRSLYPHEDIVALHRPPVDEIMLSVRFSEQEKYIFDFEQSLRDLTSMPYVVSTGSGTGALHLALLAAGVTQDDLVITSPFTFVATVNPIFYIGATPLYCEVSETSLGLNPNNLRSWLAENASMKDGFCIHRSSGKRIRACIGVYNYGYCYEIDEVSAICNAYNIALVEDAAEAVGSTFRGKHAGSFGFAGVVSFNNNKTITSGGGGAVLLRSKEHYDLVRSLANQASTIAENNQAVHSSVGFNYRMSFVNAAYGLHQMRSLETTLERKKELNTSYCTFFSAFSEVKLVSPIPFSNPNFWLNVVQFEDSRHRNSFVSFSKTKGIEVRPGWALVNSLPKHVGVDMHRCTTAQRLSETIVALPGSLGLK